MDYKASCTADCAVKDNKRLKCSAGFLHTGMRVSPQPVTTGSLGSRKESADEVKGFNDVEIGRTGGKYRLKISKFPGQINLNFKAADAIIDSLFEDNAIVLTHSKSVGVICNTVAQNMNFTQDEIDEIRTAGLLHDIGKIEISEKILNKIGKLNNDEWDEIKKHSLIGYRILKSLPGFLRIADFILEHHERWDGGGYPNGLKGEGISLQARIIAVADAFDAMTSNRPYRKAIDMEDALAEIQANAGTQFDPDVVKALLDVFRQKALYA